MANELEKYEGLITVPTGGWALSVQEFTPNAGPATVTVPAGDYFWNSTASGGSASCLSTLASQLTSNGTLGGTYTATMSDDNLAATGKVTLAASGVTTFSVSWSSTVLRDLLGWTGNISGAASYVAPEHAERLWLPPVVNDSPEFPIGAVGWQVSDYIATVAPSGYSKRLGYARRYRGVIKYRQVYASKMWKRHEVTTNESLEKFWEDVIHPGYGVRFHPDRATDGTYVNWVLVSGDRFKPTPDVPGWQGARSLWSWDSELIEALY